jgi:hypothetical protein
MAYGQEQVTREDFRAEKGQFILIQRKMGKAQLAILGNLRNREAAVRLLEILRYEKEDDSFTLYDENGPIEA